MRLSRNVNNTRTALVAVLAINLVGCRAEMQMDYLADDTAEDTALPEEEYDDGASATSTATEHGTDDGSNTDDGDDDTRPACADQDGDGYGDPDSAIAVTELTDGFVWDCADCNDASASVHPGASDTTADGVDQDCDGTDAVTSSTTTWYRDADGDGYGTSTDTTSASTQPSGYVSNSSDCDDSSAAVSPADTEVTGNGKDDDCNALTSDTASSSSSSLIREACVVSSTSAFQLAYYDDGSSADRTHWVTEVSSTATVVSPILTGSSGATGCVSITLASAGTTLCFNGYGSDSALWGKYLVGAHPGSGTFAYESGTTYAAEVKIAVDATVNSSSDSSAETATFDGYNLCWTD